LRHPILIIGWQNPLCLVGCIGERDKLAYFHDLWIEDTGRDFIRRRDAFANSDGATNGDSKDDKQSCYVFLHGIT